MQTIDIRDKTKPVDKIVFADVVPGWQTATHLRLSGGRINIASTAVSGDAFCLHSKADVRNLIKALEKTIELEWVA